MQSLWFLTSRSQSCLRWETVEHTEDPWTTRIPFGWHETIAEKTTAAQMNTEPGWGKFNDALERKCSKQTVFGTQQTANSACRICSHIKILDFNFKLQINYLCVSFHLLLLCSFLRFLWLRECLLEIFKWEIKAGEGRELWQASAKLKHNQNKEKSFFTSLDARGKRISFCCCETKILQDKQIKLNRNPPMIKAGDKKNRKIIEWDLFKTLAKSKLDARKAF